jgi:hypothetical protein
MIDRLIDISAFIALLGLLAIVTRRLRPQQWPAVTTRFICHTCHESIPPLLVRHTTRGPEHLHTTYTQANTAVNVGHAVTLQEVTKHAV